MFTEIFYARCLRKVRLTFVRMRSADAKSPARPGFCESVVLSLCPYVALFEHNRAALKLKTHVRIRILANVLAILNGLGAIAIDTGAAHYAEKVLRRVSVALPVIGGVRPDLLIVVTHSAISLRQSRGRRGSGCHKGQADQNLSHVGVSFDVVTSSM
jgi:hypothetical protein